MPRHRPLAAALIFVSVSWTGAEPAGFTPAEQPGLVASAGSTTSTKPAGSTSSTSTAPPDTTTTAGPSTTVTTVPPSATTTTPPAAPPSTEPPGQRAPVNGQPGPVPVSPAPARDISAYRGLGTWVDAFDFSPQYQANGGSPPVTPDSVDDMAALGNRTLYLQAAKDDVRSPGLLVNPEILGPMLARAHARGMKVVAWYLPKFYDLDSDMARLNAMRDFRYEGGGFDGIGLDIEWRKDVPDHAERNRRLIDLSQRLRAAMGDAALSAIPIPPVVMEVVNTDFWPDFPWRELAPLYDVWLPQNYWTFRTMASGYRDGYRYNEENIRRLRNNLGQPDAPVHPIGGTDNRATDEDYRGFVRSSHEQRAIGGSIYDLRTTPPHAWEILRGLPG